jgi:hypothetical protein
MFPSAFGSSMAVDLATPSVATGGNMPPSPPIDVAGFFTTGVLFAAAEASLEEARFALSAVLASWRNNSALVGGGSLLRVTRGDPVRSELLAFPAALRFA